MRVRIENKIENLFFFEKERERERALILHMTEFKRE